jgi:uncharacterized protein YqeY
MGNTKQRIKKIIMKLEQRIKTDIKKSMIGQNSSRTTLLRTVLGEFNRESKSITDERAVSIIKKMKQNAVDIGDSDEIKILSEYLPTMLTDTEISEHVNSVITSNSYSIKDMGLVMKELKTKYGQTMDMKVASQLVRTLLK